MRRKDILRSVMASDAKKIRFTYENLNKDAFHLAVDTISRGKSIYVIGLGNCAPLASFLAMELNLMFDNVRLLRTSSPSELYEQMIHIGERDVVIAISFPRYSMRTVKVLEFANRRKAKVVTITDEELSPVNLYSSCQLIAKCDRNSVADSLVAPMSLVHALIAALSKTRRKKLLRCLEELEDLWEDNPFGHMDEIDPVDEIPSLKPGK